MHRNNPFLDTSIQDHTPPAGHPRHGWTYTLGHVLFGRHPASALEVATDRCANKPTCRGCMSSTWLRERFSTRRLASSARPDTSCSLLRDSDSCCKLLPRCCVPDACRLVRWFRDASRDLMWPASSCMDHHQNHDQHGCARLASLCMGTAAVKFIMPDACLHTPLRPPALSSHGY